MIVRLDYHLYDEIVKYAREHLPEEACGLIAGEEDETGRLIKKVYYLANHAHIISLLMRLVLFHVPPAQKEHM